MAHLPDGLGTTRCTGMTRDGWPCWAWVVAGFAFCLHHVPDADLEAAEAVVGFRRCRRCRQYAVKGTDPPRCKIHGGCNVGSAQWRNAQMRAAAIEIAEQALGLRTWRKRRAVPLKATWRNVA